MMKSYYKNYHNTPILLIPKIISSYSTDIIRDWLKNENSFCKNSMSKTFLLLATFLLVFIPLDITYSTNNPTLLYSALHRGIPSILLFIFGFWLRKRNTFFGEFSYMYYKSIALFIMLLIITLQYNYTEDFPDRTRMFSPLIMAFSIYFTRVGPFTSTIFATLQLLIWSYFVYLRPEALADDLNYQLFGLILVFLFQKNIAIEANRFLKDLEINKAKIKFENEKRKTTELALKRFLPKKLVDEIVKGSKILDTTPKNKDITVLFANICNFSNLVSHQTPLENAFILNSYFSKMTDVIFSNRGILDKFMGDGIMVTFGTFDTSPPKKQAQHALNCALSMSKTFTELAKEWRDINLADAQIRIGIHHGKALVGDFGNSSRSEYTAIGNTINVASRIEGQAGKGEIHLSEELFKLIENEETFVDIGIHSFKGIDDKVRIYKYEFKEDDLTTT